jgi:hypothetical protein
VISEHRCSGGIYPAYPDVLEIFERHGLSAAGCMHDGHLRVTVHGDGAICLGFKATGHWFAWRHDFSVAAGAYNPLSEPVQGRLRM